MNFETELVSQTVQDGERYLNFDLEAEEEYPVRVRSEEDRLEVLIGESFANWEKDYISRRRLVSGWQDSFYIEEDMELYELKQDYEEVFERNSEEIENTIEPQTTGSLNQVRAALD